MHRYLAIDVQKVFSPEKEIELNRYLTENETKTKRHSKSSGGSRIMVRGQWSFDPIGAEPKTGQNRGFFLEIA